MKTSLKSCSNESRIMFSVAAMFSISFAPAPVSAGLVPTPVTAVASAIGLAACLEIAEIDGRISWGERIACYSIAFDPLPSDVAEVSLSLTFDPSHVQFSENEVYFFGDFSDGGDFLPVVAPSYGGYSRLQPVPDISDFDPSRSGTPRAGSTYNLNVDNEAGTLSFSMDLSDNPIPADAIVQNMFAFNMFTTDGTPIKKIQYFDTPGDYTVNQSSFACRLSDASISRDNGSSGCGSDTPVYGFIVSVPSPQTAFLLLGGLFALSAFSRRSV